MIHKIYFQDLGLVNTSDMFRQAMVKHKNEKVLGCANRA